MSLNQPSLLKNRQGINLIAFEECSAYLTDASAKGGRGKIESMNCLCI